MLSYLTRYLCEAQYHTHILDNPLGQHIRLVMGLTTLICSLQCPNGLCLHSLLLLIPILLQPGSLPIRRRHLEFSRQA